MDLEQRATVEPKILQIEDLLRDVIVLLEEVAEELGVPGEPLEEAVQTMMDRVSELRD